ncbi:unnamed protein product [Pichia kudriavzevii]
MTETPMLPLFNPLDKDLSIKWKKPEKKIFSSVDIPFFQKSRAIANINGIVSLICTKVSATNVPDDALESKYVEFEKKNSHITNTNQQKNYSLPPKFVKELPLGFVSQAIVQILDELKNIMSDTPPINGPKRYGNLAYSQWFKKVDLEIDRILDDTVGKLIHTLNYTGFKDELRYYIMGSFGSYIRLDYGTGHELSYIAFLGCLTMIGIIDREKFTGSEWLFVLAKYYDLIKALILRYTLEPAGSHGVWGLDDHFHLIYVFGACQLVNFKEIGNDKFDMNEERAKILNFRMGVTPSSTTNPETLKNLRLKNLFFNAISFIKLVKTGPFNEHSPILYEISATRSWEKVARGTLRMYYGEVLSKHPVVQHFYFGGVFYPWEDLQGNELPSSGSDEEDYEDGKYHIDKSDAIVATTKTGMTIRNDRKLDNNTRFHMNGHNQNRFPMGGSGASSKR